MEINLVDQKQAALDELGTLEAAADGFFQETSLLYIPVAFEEEVLKLMFKSLKEKIDNCKSLK